MPETIEELVAVLQRKRQVALRQAANREMPQRFREAFAHRVDAYEEILQECGVEIPELEPLTGGMEVLVG